VLFARRNGEIYHVGLYLDGGRFVHAVAKEGVTVTSLDEAPWNQRFSGGRRIE
jgi:cell wall-associated NlpC family hydrolase